MSTTALIDFTDPHGAPLRLRFGLPQRVLRAERLEQVEPVLRAAQAQAQAGAWVVGMVAYEAAPAFDPALRVRGGSDLPLAWFGVYAQAQEGDAAAPAGAPGGEPQLRSGTSREAFERDVERVREAMARGEVYQVNYALRTHWRADGDALELYRQLRAAQPGGYCAYLDLGRFKVVSASPELFFRRDGDMLTTRPMKGTRPRGRTWDEDQALARELHQSPKDRAENLMIVDLLRNDLSRLALPHGVEVPARFQVETFPTVLQMTSTVTARMRPGFGLQDIFRALFPCGSVTGAPKVQAMKLIAGLESEPRGAYCGALGVVRPGGDATFNVAIRTVTVDAERGSAVCGLGSGIVWDSTAAGEYAEVMVKGRFLRAAAADFSLLETLRIEAGRALRLELHLARLQASARYFGIAAQPLVWEAAARRAAAQATLQGATQAARLRLLLDARGGFTAEVSALPLTPQGPDGGPPHIALGGEPVCSDDAWLFHKTTRRERYERAAATQPQAFDVLLRNEQGELTEFTRGNLMLELDGRLCTPALDCGLLDGCLRREWLDQGLAQEARLRAEDLLAACRIWFVNSLRGAIEVVLDPAQRRRIEVKPAR